MIPIFINDGPVWLVGIAWNSDKVAAFLAWWMPLNLLTYLFAMAWFRLYAGYRIDKDAVTLKRFSLAMLFTWPVVFGTLASFLYEQLVTVPIKRLKARRSATDHHRRPRP